MCYYLLNARAEAGLIQPQAIVSGLTVAYIRRIHYEFALFSRTPVSCTRLVVLL